MNDHTFDLNPWFDAYRGSFASVHKVQQEGFKAVERFARFQYALAGDCLEAGIAQAQATLLAAKSPAEMVSKHVELGTRLSEKLRARAQEFLTLASEVQGTVATLAAEAADRATAPAKKAA